MTEVMHLLAAGHRVALVGGGDSLRALALAARDLKDGRRTTHPELVLFPSWGELQDYAAHDPAGRDLQPLVDLVDKHGTDAILAAVDHLARRSSAPRSPSPPPTRPKAANGPRADRRRLHPAQGHRRTRTTTASPVPGPIDDAEARLAYVAVTRARHRLDLGGLAWINQHPDGNPPAAESSSATRGGGRQP